ncbi:MAG: radical SAM protein [Acidimicrobiia bacterium]
MIASLARLAQLSRDWGINEEDILLIALNASGVRSPLPSPRMRFRVRLNSRPEEQFFLILSLGRAHSPFELDDHEIRFDGRAIAEVEALEDDDAVLGYFRQDRRALTLNSNARSECTGCVFCPNTLEAASDPRLAALDDLDSYLAALVHTSSLPDLAAVERVTVCTGCFVYEHLALQHLGRVRDAMTKQRCGGTLHFLSSVLTTGPGLTTAADMGRFHLTITAECFTRRDVILKRSKAQLTPEDMVSVLARAKDRGITGDFTYIVGLDPPAVALERLASFVPVTTAFPKFQVYQSHNLLMDVFLADGAREIEFYLHMRGEIERLFRPTGLRPQSWENYRPLWYFTFAGEPLSGVRI